MRRRVSSDLIKPIYWDGKGRQVHECVSFQLRRRLFLLLVTWFAFPFFLGSKTIHGFAAQLERQGIQRARHLWVVLCGFQIAKRVCPTIPRLGDIPKIPSPILVESPCLWASHFLNSSRCSWQTWRKLQPKSCDITLFINISLHLGCVLWYLFFCCKVEMPTEPAFYQSVVCISYPTVAMSSSWSSINPADWGESESMTKRKIQRSLSGNSRTWKWSYSVVPQKSIWIPYFLGRFAPWMNSNSISTIYKPFFHS